MSDETARRRDDSRAVHVPVLPREVIHYLDLQPGQIVVDGTVGAAGHSRQILKRIEETGTLIGLDRDPMMLNFASEQLPEPNCRLVQRSYLELEDVLDELEFDQVDRVLLDLGLSSDQLADESRGFSLAGDGPLDMRFDKSRGEPASELIARLNEVELADIFERFGEERFSRRIARHLVSLRGHQPIQTARDLAEAVEQATPRGGRIHPATRVFQALRIAVNEELGQLESFLKTVLPNCLKKSGRAVIISFHSLEDRLVKNAFRDKERFENLTSRPVTSSGTEQRVNPRSRSAKLRAAVRL